MASRGTSRAAELGNNLAGFEAEVIPAVVEGRIGPVIDQTLPWNQHATAAARLHVGGARGKIVLTIGA